MQTYLAFFGPLLTRSVITGLCLATNVKRSLSTFLGFNSASPSLCPFWACSEVLSAELFRPLFLCNDGSRAPFWNAWFILWQTEVVSSLLHWQAALAIFHLNSKRITSGVAIPIVWGAKMFDFRLAGVFCLGHLLSKHNFKKRGLCSVSPPPGYAYARDAMALQKSMFHSV